MNGRGRWVWLSEGRRDVLIDDKCDGHSRNHFSQVGRDPFVEPSQTLVSGDNIYTERPLHIHS